MSDPLILQTGFALESFLLDAQARQLRPATLRFYRQQLTYFLTFAAEAGVQQPEQISALSIRAYLARLQERGVAPASVQAAARAIRAFCNFLVAEELLAVSPMKRVKMPKADRRKPDAFTPDEVQRLLAHASSGREQAIILCLLDSGCRASEFVSWTVGDVNVVTGTVRVRQTKSRAERVAYLGNKARRALLKHLTTLSNRTPETPLWQNTHSGAPLQPNGLNQLLRRIGRAAGIAPCGPHKFRRTFASWCVQNGMNVYDLKTLMGHSGLEMLLHYLDNDVQAAHSRYGAVDRMLARALHPKKNVGAEGAKASICSRLA